MPTKQPVIDGEYLPFTQEQLRCHFAPTNKLKSDEVAKKHLARFTQSAKRYHKFMGQTDRPVSISNAKKPRQIEKDEQFWTAATLLGLYHSEDRAAAFASLLQVAFRGKPPFVDPEVNSWEKCLSGDRLKLYFEAQLPSPKSYQEWLADNFDDRHLIPYVRDAIEAKRTRSKSPKTEGPTHVDALLLNPNNGFAVIFEAKLMSDISCDVTFDGMRNQIARNIDVMLDDRTHPVAPLDQRRPDRTLFTFVTPQMFRMSPSSRLYGWLMKEYCSSPDSIARDLPNRNRDDWPHVATRLAWITWEQINAMLDNPYEWIGPIKTV